MTGMRRKRHAKELEAGDDALIIVSCFEIFRCKLQYVVLKLPEDILRNLNIHNVLLFFETIFFVHIRHFFRCFYFVAVANITAPAASSQLSSLSVTFC